MYIIFLIIIVIYLAGFGILRRYKIIGPELVLDYDQQKALDLMETTSDSILLTGRAGTGKSVLLKRFKDRKKKNIALLAYTGIAALNIKGQTIHSFFGFGIDITPNTIPTRQDQSVYKNLHTIVIDEISMVRADLLDCIDIFLRKNGPNSDLPFGGIQMIFIGDLFQLPPIVKEEEKYIFDGHPYASPYFFSSTAFKNFEFQHLELKEMHRQDKVKQKHFIDFLDAIREGIHTDEHLAQMNKRYDPFYDENKETQAVCLVTTNEMAHNINERKLRQLKTKEYIFYAHIEGTWDQKDFPTDEPLKLKVGAQIMLLNNDPEHRWVNGDVGKILKIDEKSGLIKVKVQGSPRSKDYIGKWKWKRGEYSYNEETKQIEYLENGGTFSQYPMKLAWAFTIHKAQGKTFDKVIINLGNRTWAHGQAYVGLSRGRTLEKTTLIRPVTRNDIKVDQRVIEFVRSLPKHYMTTKTAIFGGGCFWCVEHDFHEAPGVIEIISGYSGGNMENPSYEDVSHGSTGHREVVQVTYDANKTNFKKLCQFFLDHIDPTDTTGQFADKGESYKSAIYYENAEEKSIAESVLKELAESGVYDKPVTVELLSRMPFYPAEEYHQNYAEKNPGHYALYRKGSGREDFVNRTCAIREEKHINWKD